LSSVKERTQTHTESRVICARGVFLRGLMAAAHQKGAGGKSTAIIMSAPPPSHRQRDAETKGPGARGGLLARPHGCRDKGGARAGGEKHRVGHNAFNASLTQHSLLWRGCSMAVSWMKANTTISLLREKQGKKVLRERHYVVLWAGHCVPRLSLDQRCL